MKTRERQRTLMAEKGYLTMDEAAELVGLTRTAISLWCSDGKIESTKLGKHRYIKRDSLMRHLGADATQALGLVEAKPARGKS